ncbi:hypothetical protein DZK25_09465 [Wenzhouxiangella sp. 15181]|nr:hypothetical protein DZK25_09465 [Wenzhouxiangella sp. 15181]RFP69118.1 hypothetical protein DZK26_04930 [Wenzhouxiangella sp. 15190]
MDTDYRSNQQEVACACGVVVGMVLMAISIFQKQRAKGAHFAPCCSRLGINSPKLSQVLTWSELERSVSRCKKSCDRKAIEAHAQIAFRGSIKLRQHKYEIIDVFASLVFDE